MSDIWGHAVSLAERNWHRPATAVFSSITAAVAVALLVSRGTTATPTLLGWVIVAAVPVLVLALWLRTNRLPKIPRGKVGIALAIQCDDEQHARQVQSRVSEPELSALR